MPRISQKLEFRNNIIEIPDDFDPAKELAMKTFTDMLDQEKSRGALLSLLCQDLHADLDPFDHLPGGSFAQKLKQVSLEAFASMPIGAFNGQIYLRERLGETPDTRAAYIEDLNCLFQNPQSWYKDLKHGDPKKVHFSNLLVGIIDTENEIIARCIDVLNQGGQPMECILQLKSIVSPDPRDRALTPALSSLFTILSLASRGQRECGAGPSY
jgi:hypothetical protein